MRKKFKLKSGNCPDVSQLSGSSPFTQSDALEGVKDKVSSVKDTLKSAKDKLGDSGKFVAKQGVKKKVAVPAVKAGLSRVGAKGAARLVPGVGYGLLAADTGKLMMEQKAKGYAEIDAKSPGTSRHLETGAYGNQKSKSGHKVKGTFFGSMK